MQVRMKRGMGGPPAEKEATGRTRPTVDRLTIVKLTLRCAAVKKKKGASHQIWVSCQILQFWWLAPFNLHAAVPLAAWPVR